MGVLVEVGCPCGYENRDLIVGAGMLTVESVRSVPALCEACREVVEVNQIELGSSCPRCGGPVVPYDDPSLRGPNKDYATPSAIEWDAFSINEAAYYRCPRCLQPTMSFRSIGNFD